MPRATRGIIADAARVHALRFRSRAVTHRTLYNALLPSAIVRPPSRLTPTDCLMTRPWCRQRGALRAALFLLPRAFYRHPLLIAVVPHWLRRESIYHYHHHRRASSPHHHTATLHRRNLLGYARGVSALKLAADCTNFSLAARARYENTSGFGLGLTRVRDSHLKRC